MTLNAEIISVGTEILLGNIVNTDAADLSEYLSELGINVYHHSVVGDNPARLREVVDIAKGRANLLITTGGLGPTCDDLTKNVLAESFGRKLVYNEEAARVMEGYFRERHPARAITENNYQQAYLPEGCTPFQNTCGTAPGCAFEAEGVHVIMLPGPPRECRTMFRVSARPYLLALTDGGALYTRNIRVFGLGEAEMESRLRDLMNELKNPTLAPYAKDGECMLRLTARAPDEAAAERLMAPVLEQVRAQLGEKIYSEEWATLEETVLHLLLDHGKTLAAAESCTGGLIAKRITDLPGASRAFRGGAVTYATETKTAVLGVEEALLEEKGPVCREVAIQMARGVRTLYGADLGVGVTGVAGPDSDERGNPVGTVFVALSVSSGVFCRELSLGHDRARVRTSAAHHAFDMIRRYLTGLPIE